MIFKVQNLGYIEEASVDLSKDLIVLTGQNNTGKTYLAYAIYGLLKSSYEDVIFDKFNNTFFEKLADKFIKQKGVYIDWDNDYKMLFDDKDVIINNMMQNLLKEINLLFANYLSKVFKNVNFVLDINEVDIKMSNPMEIDEFYLVPEQSESLANLIPHCFLDFVVTSETKRKDVIDLLQKELVFKTLCNIIKKNTYIAPAERNAINIFSKELSLTKSKLFRNGHEAVKNAQFVNRYPKPIQDNLEIAEDLAFLSKNKSEFEYLAIELEKDFLKGKITTNQYGQIEYQPDNQEDISLEIHLTASMVKSLSNIVFYLRHLAQKGDCIIIDEPELNLHPDNQRKIARFIGRLINEGFQVVISTHSDYIIKELNNMIMLSKAKGNNQDLIEKLGFRGDELLKPEQVQALLFTLDSRKPADIEITEEGFSVRTIDETIAKQDALTEEIYYQLFEQETV